MHIFTAIKKVFPNILCHSTTTLEIPVVGSESVFISITGMTVVIYFGHSQEVWFDAHSLRYHKFSTPIGRYAAIVDSLLEIFKDYYTPSSVKFIESL